MAIVGIDLGTTNSLVSFWKDGKAHLIPNELGEVLIPSVISFFEKNEIAVGEIAKEQLILQPEKTVASFKRYMGTQKLYKVADKEYKPMELSSLVLKEIKKRAEKYLGEEIEEAIVTVPAYFNDKQRSDTKKAAQLAGLKVERLINEPSAAALAFQMASDQQENNIVVFDFGGGTLDLSYVECFDNVIEIVAVAGDNMLGGDDIDKCIFDYVCQQKGYTDKSLTPEKRAELIRQIVQQKCKMQDQNVMVVDGEEITNHQLFEICVSLFQRIKKLFLRLLEDAGVRVSELDDIVMVGGSSKLPIVKQFLTELLGKEPVVLGEADRIVALGAGTYAGIRQRESVVKDIIMTDVCPFSLGIETHHDKEEKKGYMCAIIPRNTTLPTKEKQRFFTLNDFQSQINTKIYQGEEYYAEENLLLGEICIDVPKRPAGKEWIDVEFCYDINGILQVSVENSKGERRSILLANQELSARELERYQSQMEEIIHMKSPWEREEYTILLKRLQDYYEESVGETREYLGKVITWYVHCMYSGRMRTIRDAKTEIQNILTSLDTYEENKERIFFDGENKQLSDEQILLDDGEC